MVKGKSGIGKKREKRKSKGNILCMRNRGNKLGKLQKYWRVEEGIE